MSEFSEFASKIQTQADLIASLLTTVDAGDGTPMGDRVLTNVTTQSAATPPCILVAPPGWKYEAYQFASAGPEGLDWEVWIVSLADDQAAGRLWTQALEVAGLLEASVTLNGLVTAVRAGVWRAGSANPLPAYIVAVSAPLP